MATPELPGRSRGGGYSRAAWAVYGGATPELPGRSRGGLLQSCMGGLGGDYSRAAWAV